MYVVAPGWLVTEQVIPAETFWVCVTKVYISTKVQENSGYGNALREAVPQPYNELLTQAKYLS